MKPLILSILMVILPFVLGSCTSKHNENDVKAAASTANEEYYTCPMHPSVRSDRPGACPVCGMALVKKSSLKEMSTQELAQIGEVSLSPTQRVLANVATETVQRRTLKKEISAVGVVSVAEPMQASIGARFRGRVEKLHVNYTGETLRKGQPLFELYSPDVISATQDFLLALDGLRSAKSAGDSQSVVSQGNVLRASRTRLQMHYGMLEQQIKDIETSRTVPHSVRFDSPIQGTVLSKQVQEGQFVDEGMVLYQLADLSKVWIYLDIYEGDVRFVKVGTTISITTEAYPGEEFRGTVTFIDPTMNPETRTVRVRTEFANPKSELKPNLYVKARLEIPVQNAIAVPASAVINTGKRSVVWVESKENTFVPRDVTVGLSTDSHCEILSGLEEGEVIAISGGFLIDSESQLQQPTSPNPQGKQKEAAGAEAKPDQSASTPSSQHKKTGPSKGAVVDVKILVKGGYTPDVIKVKLGKKVRLHFYRDEESGCSSEVMFEKFNIRRSLPAYETTVIEITPTQADTIEFTCGMKMLRGTLIVER